MTDSIKTVTDATFDAEVLGSAVPVLVDYWAEWCTPCKMIAPLLADAAESYRGRLSVAKIDLEANPKIPTQFRVRSIPTLMLFRDGRPVATHVGALSRSQLAAFIDTHVENSTRRAAEA